MLHRAVDWLEHAPTLRCGSQAKLSPSQPECVTDAKGHCSRQHALWLFALLARGMPYNGVVACFPRARS